MEYNGLINIMKKSIIALMACAMLCGSAQYVDFQIGKNLVNTALEPDIPSDLNSTPTPHTDNGLKGYGNTFVWDGESMVKQEE